MGSLTLVWYLAENLPASYRVRWKEASVASYPSSGTGVQSFDASAAAAGPVLVSRGAVYSYEITGLKTCTVYDVELKGFTGAGVLRFTREVEGTPRGTPSSVRDALLVVMSKEGKEVRVFWRRPACGGGYPLEG